MRIAWNAFEVVSSLQSAAVEFGLAMEADRHRIMPDGDWIRWARKTFGKPDLFVYHHLEHDTFVLAEWLVRPTEAARPVCMELETMDEPPDRRPGQLSREYLEMRFVTSGDMVERMRKSMREMQWLKRESKVRRGAARREAVRQLRKKGLEMEAMCIEKGRVAMDYEEDEISDYVNGELRAMAHSPRLISTGR